jgi:very-short-patch-repair endonuclease
MDYLDNITNFPVPQQSSLEVSPTPAELHMPDRPALVIEIEADATSGYASIQNSIPIIRSLRLTNDGTESIENIQVLINCNPRFAEGIKIRFDRLNPTETRLISPLDLRPDHAFLADLQEAVRATISVTALSGSSEIAHLSQTVEVLAYDQWAGTRALPELLAAFCMPNNPAVDILVGKASKLLRSIHSELSMSGYQSKSRDVVWKQISAIYSTISAESLQYAEPPASFGTDGQKIRTPDRILESRVATCLDLAMLFASCFEQAGLRPVVLMKEGHAWVGVWLHAVCFSDPLTDDVQAVRKRVDSGEFLVFETTGVAQHHSYRPSLRIAMEQGQAHLLQEDSFRYAVDIRRAREVQIKPLPSRITSIKPAEREDAEEQLSAIEATPILPPLEASTLTALDLSNDDTPEGRLAKWKSKLLDLTLRNKLLNFKPTKATLQFVAPNLALLEDTLSEGKEFRIRPLPSLMEGQDPRMAQVHINRSGRSPIDDMAIDALGNKELLARVSQEALDGHLLAIHGAARTGLEEGGSNTLYLAIGLLHWTEAEKAEAAHLAPILLIPVTLQRQSVRAGFRLMRHDDDAIINPTLLQLLKSNFELRIASLDLLPVDEKGIDVNKVLQSFRLAVAEIPRWEVLEQAHLGIFSFTKHLMWKDLQDRTEQLKANRVVKHLIENAGQAFAQEQRTGEFEDLDHTHRPQDILAPLLSDSSQLKAICAIDAGRDLVLEGPPGTGKSQTIANLIAHCLGKGRTVLFVSEKMAALSVVHRRLNDIGLGPFCLELHSSKSKKTEVLQQLGSSLGISGQRTADDWGREAERLALLRQELNGLVDALHREYPNGLTVFEATGTCISHIGAPVATMPWTDALTHYREDLDRLRETARRIEALAGAITTVQNHPLTLIGKTDWTPTWADELLDASRVLDLAATALRDKSLPVGKVLEQAVAGLCIEAYASLDLLADILLAAPKVPVGLARQAHDPTARSRIQSLAKHGLARKKHWDRVGPGWTPQLAKIDGTALLKEWSLATSTWWPKSLLAIRAITSTLQNYREDGKRPSPEQVTVALGALADVNEEDEILKSMQAEATVLLEETFAGLQTDWSALSSHEQWAKQFSDAVVRVAGDSQQAAALRQVLQPLVAENRALLMPAGSVGHALIEYRDAWRFFRQKLDALVELSKTNEPLQRSNTADGALERIQGIVEGWKSSKRLLQPWCLWRATRDMAIRQGLQGLITDLETGTIPLNNVSNHFEVSYRNWWLKRTVGDDPILRSFSSAVHEQKIKEFREADSRFQKLTEQYIAATLAGRIPAASGAVVGAESELGRLRRELQKQRGHIPVRQLVRTLPTLLPKLKPCLLMSPLSVSQYLDAGYSQFDLVVFDEASQISVWDAVGVIARGKQLAVVGDPKQLPPTNFFNKSTDSDETSTNEEQVEDLESILDECLGAGMNRLSLQWHYRSRHESLITFSNVTYYDSELVTFPSPVTDDIAVRFQRVHGVYDRGATRTNRAEAEIIVGSIEEHYLNPKKNHLTLGVVTFNQPQQVLIETLLEERRRGNTALDRALAGRTNEALFIKNLENVQGDERDIIFFSITYGPDSSGKITMNFGPLNGEGGHRRLNVAISRAREAVVIYSTLMPEQIDLARVRAAGVRDLKHYLEFAIRGARALVAQSTATGRDPDSPFEAAVIKLLRNAGWVVHPQVGCSGYRIDLAIVDPRAPGRYMVGIECDGRAYHSGATARDRDRLRQHVLESLGWRIHRIWSTDWWLDPEREVEKVTQLLQSLLATPVEESAEVATVEKNEVVLSDNAQGQEDLQQTPSRDLPLFSVAPPIELLPPLVYIQTSIPAGDPVKFYENSSGAVLSHHLQLIVTAEGPIPEALLFKKVARAWGLERMGSRITERLKNLVPNSAPCTAEGTVVFYWPVGVEPHSWSAFRIAGNTEESRRHINDICIEEIAALVKHVLHQAGGSPRQDVSRSVCRLVGMARTTAEAEARVGLAVDALINATALQESEHRVWIV